jgi:hypothetical protein
MHSKADGRGGAQLGSGVSVADCVTAGWMQGARAWCGRTISALACSRRTAAAHALERHPHTDGLCAWGGAQAGCGHVACIKGVHIAADLLAGAANQAHGKHSPWKMDGTRRGQSHSQHRRQHRGILRQTGST